MMTRAAQCLAALCLALAIPASAGAVPTSYVLDVATSTVGFELSFGKDKISGTIPITSADVGLDFDQAQNSHISAVLDAAGAQASFPFATQAMRGPKVLDAREFPAISFESRSMRFDKTTAEVQGDLTIRGVTRPQVFHAELYRQQGTEAGDRNHLAVILTGSLSRSAFGASGWSDMVGDMMDIRILVHVNRPG